MPVDIGIRHQVDIWMTYHPDVRSVRRVAVFIDWLRTLFDPKRYPWFGDEFIHPREFTKAMPSEFAGTLLHPPLFEPKAKVGIYRLNPFPPRYPTPSCATQRCVNSSSR